METLPELDESRETSSNGMPGSPIPQQQAITSSSSPSPNSVKINHAYVQKLSSSATSNQSPLAIPTFNVQSNKYENNDSIIGDSHVDNASNSLSNSDNSNNLNNLNSNLVDDVNGDGGGSVGDADKDLEANTPLLDAKNSTNQTTIDYSNSEKDALIINSKK